MLRKGIRAISLLLSVLLIGLWVRSFYVYEGGYREWGHSEKGWIFASALSLGYSAGYVSVRHEYRIGSQQIIDYHLKGHPDPTGSYVIVSSTTTGALEDGLQGVRWTRYSRKASEIKFVSAGSFPTLKPYVNLPGFFQADRTFALDSGLIGSPGYFPAWSWEVSFGPWFTGLFSAALGVVPMVGIGRRWWRRKSPPGSVPCPVCGYDMRATPGRCPECGTPSKGTVG